MKNNAKRLVSALIVFVMLLLFLPTGVFADGADAYQLWVGGEEVTGGNLSGDGWSYAPDTRTLTLDGFSYEGEGYRFKSLGFMGPYYERSIAASIVSMSDEGFNLLLKGNNTAVNTDTAVDVSLGVAAKGELRISGDGRLEARSGAAYIYSVGIYTLGNLYIDSGDIKAAAGGDERLNFGILARGDFYMSGGDVHAGDGVHGFGIAFDRDGYITGGRLTARGRGSLRYPASGIYFGDILIINNAAVYAIGGKWGIETEKTGGTVTVREGAFLFASGSGDGGMAVDAKLANYTVGKGYAYANATGAETEIPVNRDGPLLTHEAIVFGHDFSEEIAGDGDRYLKSPADCEHAATYYKSCAHCGLSSGAEEQIAGIAPGSADTVTIDGVEFYVLAKEEANGKALLLAKDVVKTGMRFNADSNKWSGSEMQNWLNNDWLDRLPALKMIARTTGIYTRKAYDATDFTASNDKVFLLSEADVFNRQNGGATFEKDYTYNGTGLAAPGGSWIATDADGNVKYWWLRSPRSGASFVGSVTDRGTCAGYAYGSSNEDAGVRPAPWVQYSEARFAWNDAVVGITPRRTARTAERFCFQSTFSVR